MKILYVVHGYPPTAVAGTEICAERLCAGMKSLGHEPSVLAREERPGYPEYKMIRDERDGVPVLRVVNNFTRLQARYLYHYHPRIEEIFEEEFLRLKPDLVHVQHLAGASAGIPSLARRHGVPLVVSLHDYWYACERVQLLRPAGDICPGPDGGRKCAVYCAHGAPAYMAAAAMERLRQRTGYLGAFPGAGSLIAALARVQPLFLRRRTRRMRRAYRERCERLLGGLAMADLLLAPSEKARSIYIGLGIPAERIRVIPHGLPPFPPPGGEAERAGYDGQRPLEVGYIGTVMPHKGLATLLRAVRGMGPREIRLRIHGRVYPEEFARFFERALARFPRGQVEARGTYQPSELPRILAGVDLLAIPSLWHETFNLVLWEAWAARLPVVASRVGALSDAVRDGVDGLLVAPGDWSGLRRVLRRIIREPGTVDSMRRNLPRYCMGLEENARSYEDEYRRLLAPVPGVPNEGTGNHEDARR